MIKNEIKKTIEKKIKDVKIEISSNDNIHFNAIIISDNFENKTLIERQKLIYSILEDYISSGKIHAFSFKAYTNKEYNN